MVPAAEQGDVIAQLNLGNIYLYDFQDEEKALKWYRLAAEQGDPEATEIIKKYL